MYTTTKIYANDHTALKVMAAQARVGIVDLMSIAAQMMEEKSPEEIAELVQQNKAARNAKA